MKGDTKLFTLFLRLALYAFVVIILIELFFSFNTVVTTNEIDKVIVELSENMMSSQYEVEGKKLTTSRAVFNYDAIK